jgi:GTP-binding protein
MTASKSTKLFHQEVKFIAGAKNISQIPRLFLPEIAFMGKSNVGKSSLINSVCNRRSLARVSHTPGRTQQINFFSVADKFILVDLPGYGFAKVPHSVKQEWERLIMHYLENSNGLKLVNLLVDSRRGIKEHDIEVAKLLISYNRPFQLVFTKVDKVNFKEDLLHMNKIFLESFGYSCNVINTSSKSREGAKELQLSFAKCIEQ